MFVTLGIYGYHGNRKLPFLKITMALPRLIAPAKRLLEQGFTCPGYSVHGYQCYETNIDFEIRYSVYLLMKLSSISKPFDQVYII